MKLTLSQQIKLNKLLAYSDRYQINIQFWPNQTSVFVMKHLVDLHSSGGDFDDAVDSALAYLKRVNREE